MADLFTLTDLGVWLDTEVDEDLATLVRNRVTVLIASEIGLVPDPVPAGLSALAVGIAARIYDNPMGYKSESFAGYTASYGDATLTADEKASLRMFAAGSRSRRVVASSPLRNRDFYVERGWTA